MKHQLPVAVFLCSSVIACEPLVDEDGFTTDVGVAIEARAHDFGCFSNDDTYGLQLAITGEGEDAENVAAVLQDGETNFVTGTWEYENSFGNEALSVDTTERAFTAGTLETKYGALVSFPADAHECRLRGFIPYADASPIEGDFVCEDEFWDTVTLTFDADFGLAVYAVRDDDGALTEQEDFGAYFIDGGELFVFRPEIDDPAFRFARGTSSSGAVDLYGGSCPQS